MGGNQERQTSLHPDVEDGGAGTAGASGSDAAEGSIRSSRSGVLDQTNQIAVAFLHLAVRLLVQACVNSVVIAETLEIRGLGPHELRVLRLQPDPG